MPNHPAHDESYKLLFSQPELIRALLIGIIGGDWLEAIDLATLQPLPTEQISAQLDQRRNDLLWQVQRTDGAQLYLLILLEHQSSNDLSMAVRMLTYRSLLYENLLRQQAIQIQCGLPAVLPIVLYSGAQAWTAQLDIADLIQPTPPGLKIYQPSHRYLLIDENRLVQCQQLPQDNLAALLFRLEHNRGIEDVQETLQHIYDLTPNQREVRRAFLAWTKYVLLPKALPDVKLPQLHEFIEVKNMLETHSRSWIDQWKQQGLEQGLEQGREEGREEGETIGFIKVLSALLQSKFGVLPPEVGQKLRQADNATLTRWATRVLDATTLEQVFAD